jgi:hypothetical protein
MAGAVAGVLNIHSNPSGNYGGGSSQVSFGGYSFSTAQQGALQGFANTVNAGSFDAQAFVSALQAVVNAFSGNRFY